MHLFIQVPPLTHSALRDSRRAQHRQQSPGMLKNVDVLFLQKKRSVLWSQNCKQLWTWCNMSRLCTKQWSGTSREKTLLSLHTRLASGKSQKNAVAIFFDILKNMRYKCDVPRLRLLNAGMVCVLTLLSYAHAKGWHSLDKIRFVLLVVRFCIDYCYTSIGRRPHELIKCCCEFRFIFEIGINVNNIAR